MAFRVFVYSFFILVLFLSKACQKKQVIQSPLEKALIMAGENRTELEKVLNHYRKNTNDSLKYKAACFLIENMPYYYYYEGKILDDYAAYYEALNLHTQKRNIPPAVLLDSISRIYGRFSLARLEKKYDIREIDSAYLCSNIESSFRVWRQLPWGKNVSFKDFCEYVLPYRIGNEKLTYWKDEFYNKYAGLLDSLLDAAGVQTDDPSAAAYYLMDSLRNKSPYFTTVAPSGMPNVGPKVAQYISGTCQELTDYAIYVLRSLGIPCHIDFMPIRGNDNAGHFWVSFYDNKRELYMQDFLGAIRMVRQDWVRHEPKAKVYRYTFSVNRTMQEKMSVMDGDIHPMFIDPKFIDVTYPYADCYTQSLKVPREKLYKKLRKGNVVYLCSANHMDWTPVACTQFEGGNLSFHSVQKGDVMRLATWENGKLILQSDPFRQDCTSGALHFYTPALDTADVILTTKFSLDHEYVFRQRVIGGVFEASDSPDFKMRDTLYVINELPSRQNNRINIKTKRKKYRYVRYFGAENTYCNMAEVAFFGQENDQIPLTGQLIGTSGDQQGYGTHTYQNLFDGKSWTSFDYEEPSGGWAGLEFKVPTVISSIVYTPRNYDNYIRPGDTFELFYCDGHWKSLGILESRSDSLSYKAPINSLLYLKNHSRGTQQRIFTYEEDKQVWR